MSTQRPGRVQEAIRQEISKILQSEIRDPRIGFLTVTKVELTKDLRYARVYFSVLGESKDRHLALKGLNNAKGYIKGLLSEKIKLRFMPQIEFKIDESLGRAQEIYDILDKIKREKTNEEDNRGDKEA
ncbi:MAG: 30S ribosome-binding factor RbfA [Candidatus Omnitrophota bacterium]|nr:30S ribosome-binding factor RbfA [Candidatus Omnitrophota bacterium]